MLASFSEFKFFQSFRITVRESDGLRFLVEKDGELGKKEYIDDAKLIDVSLTGLGLKTIQRLSVGDELTLSLQFKKNHLDLKGRVVRAFSDSLTDEQIIYGIEIDEDKRIFKFLENYVLSFSTERLKECLIDSALTERYTKPSDGFEMFSLLLSLFKDITYFGGQEDFIENMLEEIVRVMNAQRASIFLINPETNELEAVTALGIDKVDLHFDYRLGIAGSVFTTGVALNIDTINDSTRFNEDFDKHFSFETKSIICHPIHNREDKIIGVIEVLNKRNEDRFTVEDEKTMKVLTLVFSSVFHKFNPLSDGSQIRTFSTPFDREHALIGGTPHVSSLRNSIVKMKDIDPPVLLHGEKGVGKVLFAKILHYEGKRGLNELDIIRCGQKDQERLASELWGPEETICKLTKCRGGTVILHEVGQLSYVYQEKLFDILKEGGLPGSKISFDARIIATTSKDLGYMVDNGEFHPELYEMLSLAYISIDSLRRRPADIPALIDYFLKVECKKQGLLLKSFSSAAMEKFQNYDWPGNIRELKVCVERSVLYNPKAHIISDAGIDDSASPLVDINVKKRMFGNVPHVTDYKINLKERLSLVEREMILAEIKRHNGNKSKAAKAMGISREALRKKLLISAEIVDSLNKDGKQKKAA